MQSEPETCDSCGEPLEEGYFTRCADEAPDGSGGTVYTVYCDDCWAP